MKQNISCHRVYNSCSKCPPFAHMRSKTLTPPVNYIVNDALVHAVPSVQQRVLQFVNAVQLRLMHSLLDVTPYLVIGLWSVLFGRHRFG